MNGGFMMRRRQHDGRLKTQVALEALQGQRTVNEIAGRYQIHPSLVGKWKKEVLDRLLEILSDHRGTPAGRTEDPTGLLYEQIGRLTIEVAYLKKIGAVHVARRRTWIDPDHDALSIRRRAVGPGPQRAVL
jgi:transposase-like protein